MDYRGLANELFESLSRMRRKSFHKKVDEMSFGERKILKYLTFAKESATAGEISEHLELSTPRVASTLNALEKKGYIERRKDEQDKRIVIVNITEQGRSFVMEEHEAALGIMIRIFEQLGEHDAKEFVRINKRISDISNQMHE